jgi:uncharacterized metal-binding protein
MVDLPRKKIGIIACSGEELAEGTVSRLAALRVMEQLRPNDTVTICLPLFLAGGEGDRAFARFYPTISIDGCELRCAERATEKYSNKPAVSFTVSEAVAENHLDQPQGRRQLNAAGLQAVELIAMQVAEKVDELLKTKWDRSEGQVISPENIGLLNTQPIQGSDTATCACGSGIPVQNIMVAGKQVTVVGLPLILQQFTEAGKFPDEQNLSELIELIKIYNPIPADEEPIYREGLRAAYKNYWFKEKNK